MISKRTPPWQATIHGRIGFARIAILTIIDEELAAVRDIFNTKDNIIATPYFVDNSSTNVHEYEIVIRRAPDRGNHTALETIAYFVEDFRPEFILLIGIAGGVGRR